MKKFISITALSAMSLLFVGKMLAGVPFNQSSIQRTSYQTTAGSLNAPSPLTYPIAPVYHTVISSAAIGTSGTTLTIVMPVVQATMTFNSGVSNSTFSTRNCLTDITAQLTSAATMYMLDGATTNYFITGYALLPTTSSQAGTWTKHWDYLGPWCGTAGNTLTINILSTAGPGSETVSVDGYTSIMGLGAQYNGGQ